MELLEATGSFDVKLQPMEGFSEENEGRQTGLLSIAKIFYGDCEATSTGHMLSCRTAVPSSAGYVAMEQVTGTLHGKQGSFALMHTGIMQASGQKLTIQVVPGSGAGDLRGISGEMSINIEDGKHFYRFCYHTDSDSN
jgi:hypothetical protein